MSAFLHAIGQIVAGESAAARLSLTVPAALDLVDARIRWELLDASAKVWTLGDATDFISELSQTSPGQKTITAEIELAVPSNVVANEQGSMFQVRWTIDLRNGQQQQIFSFENFTVFPPNSTDLGAVDSVELFGDKAVVQLRLSHAPPFIRYECYRGNGRLFAARDVTSATNEAEGVVTYTGAIEPHEYQAPSLDPFTVVWHYGKTDTNTNKETTQAFVVTPIILDATKDMQNWLSRAYSDSGMQPGNMFSTADFVKYLRTGRDQFNASVTPTNFSMIAADGPIRWFWIMYSCIAAARAQYLAEGMKAFNYSGQVVQLDIDRTPFWEQLASTMEQQVQEQVKPFKDALAKRGQLDGDGSNTLSLRRGAVGAIGITAHGISPIRTGQGIGFMTTPFLR